MGARRRKERGAAGPAPEVTLRAVRALVGGGAVASLLLCPGVWLSERTFPTAPVFEGLPDIGAPLDKVLYALLLIGAAASALVPARHAMKAVVPLLVLAVSLAFFDQTRIQPWLYLYLAMLLVCARGESRAGTPDAASAAGNGLLTCLLLAACTYLWSGLHKINGGFANEAFPWLLDAFMPQETSTKFAPIGWLLGPAEAAMGLGLLLPRTRRLAAWSIVLMHGAILLSVGPFGHDWNAVVWPWNVVMSALVLLLARRLGSQGPRDILGLRGQVLRPALVLLFGVMPAFALVDRWDDYLSSALYAGNEWRGGMDLPSRLAARLPAEVRSGATPLASGGQGINLTDWAVNELGVPPYPERRALLEVLDRVCAQAEPGESVALLLQAPPDRWTGVREKPVRIPCREGAGGDPD